VAAALTAACAGSAVQRVDDGVGHTGVAPAVLGTVEAGPDALRVRWSGEPRPQVLLAIRSAGPWPDGPGNPPPPVAAMGLADADGRLHLLHVRPGMAVNGGAVLVAESVETVRPGAASLPAGAAATVPAALGWSQSDRLLALPAGATSVLKARSAVSIGAGDRVDGALPEGPPLLVRVGRTRAAAGRLAWAVRSTDPSCADVDAPTLAARWFAGVQEARPVPEQDALIVVEPLACTAGAPKRVRALAPGGGPLVRNEFWSPSRLVVDLDAASGSPVLTALLNHAEGDVAEMVLALGGAGDAAGDRVIAASLMATHGLWSDALDLLADAHGDEAELLRASIAWAAGNRPAARARLAALDAPPGPLLADTPSWLLPTIRVASTEGDIASGLQVRFDAATAGSAEWDDVGVLLARARLSQSDLDGLDATLNALTAFQGPTASPDLMVRVVELRGWQTFVRERKVDGIRSAAQGYEGLGNLAQAFATWRTLPVLTDDPGIAQEATAALVRIAGELNDPALQADAEAAAWLLYAENHASDARPPADAAARLEAVVRACVGADRHDLAARALRYGLLLLPPQADAATQIALVQRGLDAAMESRDLAEIALSWNFLARLEADRLRFKQAEAHLTMAIAFARLLSDDAFARALEAELAGLKER